MNRSENFVRWAGPLLLLLTTVIYVGSAGVVPLLDDADSFYAEVARAMNQRQDWITPYANTIRYLEKPPLFYWLISLSYGIFRFENAFTARLPTALAVVGLVFTTYKIGSRLFDWRAGFFGGLALASSIGLFLFTRIILPDALFTLLLSLLLYNFVGWLEEPRPARLWWMYFLAALAVLAKGLIGIAFPGGIIFFTLIFLGRWKDLWRLISWQGLVIFGVIAVPWHILIGSRNPGFYWFYFINEHVLRFLGRRYPMDYGTVPLIPFWFLHLVWLFPFSIYLITLAIPRNFKQALATHRTGLILLLAWAGTILLFFSFSSRLEYYTVPAFPALALLAGRQFAVLWGRTERRPALILTILSAVIGLALLAVAVTVTATTSESWLSLKDNPDLYRYYLGHLFDLTPESLRALRTPLVLAGLAFGLIIPLHYFIRQVERKALVLAFGMAMFFGAASMAFLTFAPRLTSSVMAEKIVREFPADFPVVIDGEYEEGCSVAFYAGRPVMLHNGRSSNLEYGSHYPDAPPLFIESTELRNRWMDDQKPILVLTFQAKYEALQKLLKLQPGQEVWRDGDKILLINHR